MKLVAQTINHPVISLFQSYHRWTKDKVPRNSTIPELHWHLGAHDKKKWREDQKRALGLPVTESHFQKKIRESHKIKREDGYSIKKDGCNYIVTAPQPEEDEQMQYTLSPSPFSVCVGDDCECLCQSCDNGVCAHQYVCNCDAYGRSQICKHMHLIGQENEGNVGLLIDEQQGAGRVVSGMEELAAPTYNSVSGGELMVDCHVCQGLIFDSPTKKVSYILPGDEISF